MLDLLASLLMLITDSLTHKDCEQMLMLLVVKVAVITLEMTVVKSSWT